MLKHRLAVYVVYNEYSFNKPAIVVLCHYFCPKLANQQRKLVKNENYASTSEIFHLNVRRKTLAIVLNSIQCKSEAILMVKCF